MDPGIVVAGIGVVAERFAPRGHDLPERGMRRAVLELGLDAGAEAVHHGPQSLGHVDRVGESPFGSGESFPYFAQGLQQIGEGRLAIGGHDRSLADRPGERVLRPSRQLPLRRAGAVEKRWGLGRNT